MRIWLFASLVFVTCASLLYEPTSYGNERSDSRAEEPFKILVFGDSLSTAYGMQPEQGWVNLLDQKLKELEADVQLVNLSLSGETTDGGLTRIDLALEQQQPSLVIIELGGNDGLRGYPVEAIENNLKTLVQKVQESGARAVLAGMQMPPSYGPRYSEGFGEIYARVAEATGCGLIPFFLENVAIDFDLMQGDGIHPTAEAQPLLLENVWLELKGELGLVN